MKKRLTKILAIAAAALLCVPTLVACGGSSGSGGNVPGNGGTTGGNKNYDLKVTFYDGGYGQKWLNDAAKGFEEKTGKKVGLIPSADFDCGAGTYLQSGKNLSDIYMMESMSWKGWVKSGYLEPLDDVYDAEVDTKAGKQKISDFMDQTVKGKYYMERKVGNGKMQPWVMPLGATPNAMAYNCDILVQIPHTGATLSTDVVSAETGKWIAPPTTVSELKALIADVNAFQPTDGKQYVPIGWCGKNANILFNGIYPWWAQAQGYTTSNYEGQGAFADFWNFGNDPSNTNTRSHTLDTKVYLQTGLQTGIDTLTDLLVDKTAHDWTNTLPDVMTLTAQSLQGTFVSNSVNIKPVIVFGASYLESEADKNNYLDSDKDGQRDVNFKFMPVPRLDSYTGDKDIVYCSYDDVMVVPQKAAHKDTAKEFITYLCSQDNLEAFTKATKGCMRPFNYDARQIDYEFSEFTQSVFDVYYNSLHAFEYPINCTDLLSVSNVYRYERPTFVGDDFDAVVMGFKTKTGSQIMTEIYNYVNSYKVSEWQKKYNLTVVK